MSSPRQVDSAETAATPTTKPPSGGPFTKAFTTLSGHMKHLSTEAQKYYDALEDKNKVSEEATKLLEKFNEDQAKDEEAKAKDEEPNAKAQKAEIKALFYELSVDSSSSQKVRAEADKARAEADKAQAEADKAQAEADKAQAEADKTKADAKDFLKKHKFPHKDKKDWSEVDDVQELREGLENFKVSQTDFVAESQLKIQRVMQTYNTTATLMNSLQSMLAELNKTIIQAMR